MGGKDGKERDGATVMPRPGDVSEDFPTYKTISVADLVPYARNARTHSAAQVDKIAASPSVNGNASAASLMTIRPSRTKSANI